MSFVVECEQCGVIERGDFETAGDAAEDHEQFHDVKISRVATDGGGTVAHDDSHVLAETQVAGFGFANGKVLERLLVEFDKETPAAKVTHERIDYAEPLRDRDPHVSTREERVANPHDTHRTDKQKLEIGTSYGEDRVTIDFHEHAPRVYIRHEHFDNGEWTEAAAWELHPVTGVEEISDSLVTDGGLPDTLEGFVEAAKRVTCDGCGDEVHKRYTKRGRCVGCRYRSGGLDD